MRNRLTTLFAAALLVALPLVAQQPDDPAEYSPQSERIEAQEATQPQPAAVSRDAEGNIPIEATSTEDEVSADSLPQTATPLPLLLLLGSAMIGAAVMLRPAARH